MTQPNTITYLIRYLSTQGAAGELQCDSTTLAKCLKMLESQEDVAKYSVVDTQDTADLGSDDTYKLEYPKMVNRKDLIK